MPRTYNPLLSGVRVTAYRYYEDDGSLQVATPRAAENSPTIVELGRSIRPRIEVERTIGAGLQLYPLLLEYRVGNADWAPCTTTSAVRIVDSPYYQTGDPTLTDRLTTRTSNYVFGVGVDTFALAGVALLANEHTECEWCIQAHGLSAVDVVQLRLVHVPVWSGDANNYTANLIEHDYYPTFSISSGGEGSIMIETVANLTRYGIAIASDATRAYKSVALLDVVSCDIQPRIERILTTQGRGSLSPRRALTGRVWCEGGLTCEATPNHAPYLWMLTGYAPVTSGSAVPYTHTLRLGDGLPSKYGTIVAHHANATGSPATPTHEVYAGLSARRVSIDYDAERSDTVQISLDLLGLIYGVSQSNTVTDLFASANPPADGDAPLVQTVARVQLPDGTTIDRIIRASVSIDLQRDIRWTLRGRVFGRSQQPVRALRVTGTLTAVFDTDADIRRALNQGTGQPYMHADRPDAPVTSLRIRASNNQTGAAERRIDIVVPALTITSIATPKRRDDIVTVDMEWEATYDATTQATVIIETLNAVSAYTDATALITGIGL